MRYLFFLIVLVLCGCGGGKRQAVITEADSVALVRANHLDMANDPCRKFVLLKTSDEYFQSANNRTKDCPFDSLTGLVALKEYEYSVKLDPKFWQARRNYARKLYEFHQYEKSVEQINGALKLAGGEVDLRMTRGMAYYQLGKYKEALDDVNAYLGAGINSEYAYLLRAKTEWKLGMKSKACEDYNTAIRGIPEYEKQKEFIDCN